MIRAHTVAQVRAAEDRLRAQLPPGTLLQRAATAVAVACAERLGRVYGSRVLLLVGRGDNGADALHAGARLARRGAAVSAVLLGDPVTDALAAFRAAGGTVVQAPGPAELVVDGMVGIGGRAALRPDAAALAARVVDGAPPTPLNRPPGPHRRIEVVRTDLEDYKAVKRAFGATVNDVVLAAVAGALGRFLEGRGHPVDGLELRACVPLSVRTAERAGAAGNDLTIVMAPLPVGLRDPAERLAVVARAMRELKSSRQVEGAQVLTSLENALPPAVLARASRLGFSSRMYNLLVTNVPGPQVPIYLLGCRMTDLVPLAFLAPQHTLAVGIISYDGAVTYGLLADADAVPDLADLAGHLRDGLAELVGAAGAAT